MEILVGWLIFSFIVAIAAGSRGRSGIGWFILGIFISPILALILVLILPNRREEEKAKRLANIQTQRLESGRTQSTVHVERPTTFEPDGVYSGIPYRVSHDGSIEAIMQGAKVRFRSMDSFLKALA